MTSQSSSTIDARKRLLLTLFKTLVKLSPFLSLISMFVFFWLPTKVEERFFVDEHAFPTGGIQAKLDAYNRDKNLHLNTQQQPQIAGSKKNNNNNNNSFFIKRNIPISPCFTASYRMHSGSTFNTFDVDPVIVVFASNTSLDRKLAASYFDDRVANFNLAPTMPAPILVLIASDREECMPLLMKEEGLGFGNSKISRYYQRLPPAFSSGNIRLATIVDVTGGKDKKSLMKQQQGSSLRQLFCSHSRAGESMMPNLDAVVMHAKLEKGVNSAVWNMQNSPPCFPETFKDSLEIVDSFINAVRGLFPPSHPIRSLFPSSSFMGQIDATVKEYSNMFHFFLNDLLSAVSLLRVSSARDAVQLAQREIRAKNAAPAIVLRALFDAEEFETDDKIELDKDLKHFLDGLFIHTYSFTFIHERLHHSQLGYLFASANHFISVNHLQLVVFALIIAIGVFQFVLRSLDFYLSFFAISNNNTSSPFSEIYTVFIPTVFLMIVGLAGPQYIDGKVAPLLAKINRFDDSVQQQQQQLSRPLTIFNVVVGILLAQLVESVMSKKVSKFFKLLSSIVVGSSLAFVLTLNFPFALCMTVPLAFSQSFSFSSKQFARLAFFFDEETKNEGATDSEKISRGIAVLWFLFRMATIVLALFSGVVLLHPLINVELNTANDVSSYFIGPAITFAAVTMWWN